MMPRFTVHGIPGSPYLRTVLLALEEKGADYRLAALGFGENYEPAYRRLHPFARIPVIDDGDFRLYETHAILRYLDSVLPQPPLVPDNVCAAARMDQFIGITDSYVRETISGDISFIRLVAPKFGLPVDEERVAAAIPEAEICIAAVADLAGDQPYLVGPQLTLADLMLIPHLSYFRQTPEGAAILARHPSLLGWIDRMEGRRSMAETEWDHLLELAEAA